MPERDVRYLEFPQVVVVQASAGSGKTYCLTKRYLHLLINPQLGLNQIPLRNILAITFTNKATVEMKERILELLKKLALNAFSNKREEEDILYSLGVDKKNAESKAKLIMDELIRHYNFFQVKTIDSFINALLLGSPLSIDRSANFKIKRDYLQYLCFCLDSLIEQARDDKEVLNLFNKFLQHYLFVENRGRWFPKEDILNTLEYLFKLSNKHKKAFRPFPGESKDIIKNKKYVFSQIKELSEHFPLDMNASAKKNIISFLDKSDDIFDIAVLPAYLKSLQVPMNKGKEAPDDFIKKWKRIYNLLKELVKLEVEVSYSPYVRLYQRITDLFQIISKKEDVLFLGELNRKARLLFDEEGVTVAEVYYRLATRFKHYLIDEFQDTSLLQWENLEMMVEEALSTGGSLFYVGDKKQAIYRFRGGEVELFDAIRKKFAHFNVRNTQLTENWRSQKAIVEFNNKVFSKENLKTVLDLSGMAKELGRKRKNIDEILDIFKDATQKQREDNDCGYVYVERIEEKNKQERDEVMRPKILDLLRELKSRFQYEDIAILTRDNNEVELITSWLLEAGFPVESEKTLNVIENSLIKEIISFLDFLYSPLDDLGFASFILGQVFSRLTNIACRDITEFIFGLHKEGKIGRNLPLYRLFQKKYPEIWDKYIDKFFKTVGFISPYELVTSIYQTLKIAENFKKNQAFFMKFLELIKQREDDCVGLGEFLSYLKEATQEDLYVNIAHSSSIKVLTIHKSKGLEFGVVVIPFLRMDISPETGAKGSSSYVVPNRDDKLGLMRITKDYRAFSPFLQEIYIQSYGKACVDELNNIYVALTRAQFELYIFIPKRSFNSNNKARYMIPEGINESGSKMKYRREEKDAQSIIDISPSVYKEWPELIPGEFGDWQSIKNRTNILEGNLMHTILSRIGGCQGLDTEGLIKRAVSAARAQYPFIEDFFLYEERVRELLAKKDLKSIFFVPASSVFCEKEVVNRFGDRKLIDRLIVGEKEIWIVDYKSSQEARLDHEKQINEYVQIIKDIYPKREVRGFLVYLDSMIKEEVARVDLWKR
ncbi:MAG: UvrD-helicase domain-containing protein [Candidatus Omnitrophica bacterium]|nr:UvrD-helicase domain-containing protein [Candidatus Omnitrophota bacterium]